MNTGQFFMYMTHKAQWGFFSLIDCIPYQFGLDFYSHYLFSVSLSYYLQSDGYIVNPLKGEQTLHQDFLMLYRIFSMVIDISNIPGIYGIDILPTPLPTKSPYDNLSVHVYIMMFRFCIIGKILCFRIARTVSWTYSDDP